MMWDIRYYCSRYSGGFMLNSLQHIYWLFSRHLVIEFKINSLMIRWRIRECAGYTLYHRSNFTHFPCNYSLKSFKIMDWCIPVPGWYPSLRQFSNWICNVCQSKFTILMFEIFTDIALVQMSLGTFLHPPSPQVTTSLLKPLQKFTGHQILTLEWFNLTKTDRSFYWHSSNTQSWQCSSLSSLDIAYKEWHF